MNGLDQLNQFVAVSISAQDLVIDLLLAALLALGLKIFYQRYGQTLSNRARLANNFVAIAVTTALVITIVKSSLALSLGLVGALSIVRFRTAIKEPEELAYLFLSIAIGLGLGAHQRLITVIAFVVILLILWLERRRQLMRAQHQGLLLTITLPNKQFQLTKLTGQLAKSAEQIELANLEKTKTHTRITFRLELKSATAVEAIHQQLNQSVPEATFNLVDTTTWLQ